MPRVFATREGLTGRRTATGWIITDKVPFVALPSVAAKYMMVQVVNPKNGLTVIARVMDVGPHFTDDDDYVFGTSRPRAETAWATKAKDAPSNPAGIDLGQCVWQALKMQDNGDVDWQMIVHA